MSFDRIAPHYRWLETIVFGKVLQRARTFFLGEVAAAKRVLIVGEGDGRFLIELLRECPGAQVDCVEASAIMLQLAREAVEQHGPVSLYRVQFIGSTIEDWPAPDHCYDLIVTHFFLDCFAEETLAQIIGNLAAAATSDAQWLVADFCHPPPGWRRWRARVLIAAMYLFFRAVARIDARRLVDYGSSLRAQNFNLTSEIVFGEGEIRSQMWQRNVPERSRGIPWRSP